MASNLSRKWLKNRTRAEREKHITYLSKLPMKELRKRQDLVAAQNKIAYTGYMSARSSKSGVDSKYGYTEKKWEEIGRNLDLMVQDLIEAIERKG